VLGVLFKMVGNKDWAYYLLSQIFIVITLLTLWEISGFFLKERERIISILALEGIVFFNFETPQFNVNICLLPIWALTIYFFINSIKNNKIINWIFLGLFSSLGILTKYIFIYLLASLFFYIIFFYLKKKKYNFIYSLIVFFFINFLHIKWIISNNYETIKYALVRTGLNDYHFINHLINPIQIIAKQFIILIPFFILIFFLIYKKNKNKINISLKKNLNAIIFFSFFMPIILLITTSIITGSKIRSFWFIPFYTISSIAAVSILKNQINFVKLKNFYSFLFIILIITPILYSLRSTFKDSRTGYEGRSIAIEIQKEWEKYTDKPITNIGFSAWYAGNLAYHLSYNTKIFMGEGEKFYSSPAVIISKNVGSKICNIENNKKLTAKEITDIYYTYAHPLNLAKNSIKNKKFVYKNINDHDICFIF
jgi:4-amino-4-deoxy-L-arabinose transferase-like glycosyltransferase